MILASLACVRIVFELGGTEGRPAPIENMSSLFAIGIVLDKLWENTIKAAEKYNVKVEESRHQGMALACTAARLTDTETGKNIRRFRVRLNADHSLSTRFATLAHEQGHISAISAGTIKGGGRIAAVCQM